MQECEILRSEMQEHQVKIEGEFVSKEFMLTKLELSETLVMLYLAVERGDHTRLYNSIIRTYHKLYQHATTRQLYDHNHTLSTSFRLLALLFSHPNV